MSTGQQCQLRAPGLAEGSLAVRCQALGLACSSFYDHPKSESTSTLRSCACLMRSLHAIISRACGLHDYLHLAGCPVNEKRVRLMGHESVYPKPRLFVPGQGMPPCPHLLRERPATAPNEVWSIDATRTPTAQGFRCLTAVLD